MTFLNQLKIFLAFHLLIGLGSLYAQETTNATGGDAEGVNGNIVYAVGQLLYTSYSGSNGSVSHGVLHPKETIVLAIDEEQLLNQVLTIYPNPTTDILSLDVKNMDWSNLQYQLFDINGRSIKSNRFTSQNTQINIEDLSPSVYFLKINNKSTNIKNFKIIKTN